jgi:osmotically-inducible protein OsmY
MMRYLSLCLLLFFVTAGFGCSSIAARVSAGSGDRRTAGTQVEDDAIESKSMSRIQEKFKDTAQITVTSYNRFVLITGDAANEDTKTNIERIVYSVPNVKKIANEVSVGALANGSIRRTDASMSREIKSELNKNKSLQSGAIKVATERGVVYLLGLVTHAEANVASEIASTTNDVKKVLRVFEYID